MRVLPKIRPKIRHGRWLALVVVLVLLLAGGFVWLRPGAEPTVVHTQDAIIDAAAAPESTERIQLDATLYTPQNTPAPAILLPHGFGGNKNSVADQARELAGRGFVVLTYSARGFGHSTGHIGLNDPRYEVADAVRLIDYLAGRPEVLTDNGDPKVGVTGGSYGGALAILLAGTDRRVDAIAPVITYNDLAQGLVPNNLAAPADPNNAANANAANAGSSGVFKRSWAGILFSAGFGSGSSDPGAEAVEPGQETEGNGQGGFGSGGGNSGPAPQAPANPGQSAPANAAQCGRFTAEVCQAYVELATTGKPSETTLRLLARVSPASVTKNITVPTLLVQGENDTLFGLDQAEANAKQIAEAGGQVNMIWYVGGHDGGRPGAQLRETIADWLSHHLTGGGKNVTTPFEYEVQGAFRASGAPSVRAVQAPSYPGVNGAQVQSVALTGDAQTVVRPPGANPSSISGLPGLNNAISGSSRLAPLFSSDPPGQAAQFVSAPLDSQLLLAGAPTIRLRVAALPSAQATADSADSAPRDAVLFVKLYDVGPDGARTLPGNAVAPIRLSGLPTDGQPVDVTVRLAGMVRPIEAGHSVQLVASTTDQAYSTPVEPASYRVELAEGKMIQLPVVPGTAAGSGWPVGQLVGILGVAVLAGAVVFGGALRRRREQRADPTQENIPLVIDGLTKKYRGGLTAVSDLSFRVERGQVLGLLGPNGAGKTTTLRMLMGLIQPTSGEITVFGHRVRPGAPVLSRIGSFVEGAGFLPHLSGRANLELYWRATGRPWAKAHFAEALEIAGLGSAVARRVRTYSQGMRQRLAIAQAMLGLPDLLVLDEPTNGLDPPQIHRMRDVLKRYAATGRTVLVSSHLLAEVEQTCSHVVVMHRGALVADGPVNEIVADGGEVTIGVDQPEAAVAALRDAHDLSDVDIDGAFIHVDLGGLPRSTVVATLVEAGIAVEQIGPRRRLEDVFLRLVGEAR